MEQNADRRAVCKARCQPVYHAHRQGAAGGLFAHARAGLRWSRQFPFDETEEELLELFFSFLRCFREGQPLSCLELPEGHAPTLPQLEQYCRKLDLYFSFSKAFGCPIDRDALYDKREDAAESINQILLYNLKNNIRFCARCGAALPLHQSGRLCQSCYRKISALRRPTRW